MSAAMAHCKIAIWAWIAKKSEGKIPGNPGEHSTGTRPDGILKAVCHQEWCYDLRHESGNPLS